MNTKRKLRLFIQLSMLGALSMGITSTHDAVAFAAASSISQVAEFHNRMQETADNGAITILPINRAKFWAGQRFDFEVEFPKNSTNFNVGINGEGAEKVFGKKAIITDYGTHISYRINNVTFDKIGEKRVTASASGLSGRLQAKAAYTVVQEKARRRAKNVILFIGDGMSMQAKELGRILSKGLSNGKFNDVLSMEKMPSLALVTTSGYDSIVTDSANSMSAYMTGFLLAASNLVTCQQQVSMIQGEITLESRYRYLAGTADFRTGQFRRAVQLDCLTVLFFRFRLDSPETVALVMSVIGGVHIFSEGYSFQTATLRAVLTERL